MSARALTPHEAIWVNKEGTRVIVDERFLGEERRAALDQSERAEDLQRLNTARLSEIQATTGLRINPDAWAKWRPTRETPGEIPGIALAVCLATDGNVAWFKLLAPLGNARPQGASGEDNEEDPQVSFPSSLGPHFLGHVHRFEWQDGEGATQVGCPPSAFAKDKVKAFRAKVKRKTKAEKLDDLLSGI